jgi:hypothetical protein
MIKESAKIISQKDNESGGVDYILENGSKLGESFHFLPAGIINKRETGIGATTLEMKSLRNSIIIEPLKITVVEKELQERGKEQPEYKLFAFLVDEPQIYKRLSEYLNDSTIRYKKIILVIDNLEKLILQLGEAFLDYFFLFDEIDYMQSGSRYRGMIEYGIDIGKLHNNFAVVSATLIPFSDPDLLSLPVTSYSYETPEFKEVKIDFYNAHRLYSTAVSLKPEGAFQKRKAVINKLVSYIVHLLKSNEDKIMVALNSVKLIEEISEFLVRKELIKKEEITLLISDKPENKPKKEKFSNRTLEDEKLPTRLNFITSAYFNGYDLKDEYRLLIFSSPPIGSNMLSINEIKQIYGRNRIDGIIEFVLFSHDVELDDIENPELMDLTHEDFIEMAKKHVEVAHCIEKHFKTDQKKPDKVMQIFLDSFENAMENNRMNFSRRKIIHDSTDLISSLSNPFKKTIKFEIAYFQIDYFYHIQSVLKSSYLRYSEEVDLVVDIVYERHSNSAFLASLEDLGFKFKFPEYEYEAMNMYEDTLKEADKIKVIFNEVKKHIMDNNAEVLPWSKNHQKIYEIIRDGQKIFTLKSIYHEINKLTSFKAITGLSMFIASHEANNQHVLVREIKYHFKIGATYSAAEIQDKVTHIFEILNRKNPPKSFSSAKTYLNLYYTLESITKRENKDKVSNQYKVIKGSPYSLKKNRNKQL